MAPAAGAYTADQLAAQLTPYRKSDRLIVAYSGGLDSTVLLHSLAQCRARDPGFPTLLAVHVHHGLQAAADLWPAHCGHICAQLGIELMQLRVDAAARDGASPEAAARAARYAALDALLGPDDCLLTAHHADDQAETVLLQLLRGAGPEGLAAMPAAARRGTGWHLRPMLAWNRADLRRYAEQHRLAWVEDPTNACVDADRNFLRHDVLLRLQLRWPGVIASLNRVAALQAQAASLMQAVAAEDLVRCNGSSPDCLSVHALLALAAERRALVLRAWIRQSSLPMPHARHLIEAERTVLRAGKDAMPCLHWPGVELRRYRDDLFIMAPLGEPPGRDVRFCWDGVATAHVQGVTLDPVVLAGMGEPPAGPYEVRFRAGGECCKPRGRAHHTPLRKLYQQAGVPPWVRERLPLLYRAGRLTGVYGYWWCED